MENELIPIPKTGLTANELTIAEMADKAILDSRELVIYDNVSMEAGASAARSLKAVAKKVEEIRKAKVAPLNEQVKVINFRLNNIINPLETAAKDVQDRMLSYTKEQEKIAREEQARRAAAEKEAQFAAMLAAKDAADDELVIDTPKAEPMAVAVPKITRSVSGAVASVRKAWKFEVIDIQALALHDPSLVMEKAPDINAQIRQGVREIPGLRIYLEETMGVR